MTDKNKLEYTRVPSYRDYISEEYYNQKADDKHGVECLVLIILLIILSGLIEGLLS